RLEEELCALSFLSTWTLVRPVSIDAAGNVARADVLMGDRRLKARPFALALDAADVDRADGDVRPERSLLLVSPDKDRYLVLFPLLLFPVHLEGQGVYFLQRSQWKTQK